jgi:amino acid permease
MTFLSGLETYSLFFIGVYAVDQVWNVFTKERTQTQIFTEALTEALLWAGVWIVFDKIVGI